MTSILYSFIPSFLWGLIPIIKKMILKSVSPIMSIALSSLIFSLGSIFLIFIYSNDVLKEYNDNKGKINYLSVIGLVIFSTVLALIAEYVFLNLLTANNSYLIVALTYSSPLFTLILAYFILKEKITLYGTLGVLFIVIGLVFVGLNNS